MSRRYLVLLAAALVACGPPRMRLRVAGDDGAVRRVFVADEWGAPVPAEGELLHEAEVVCEGCATAPWRERPGAYAITLEPVSAAVRPKLTIRAPGYATVTLTVDEAPEITEGGTLAWVVVLKRSGS